MTQTILTDKNDIFRFVVGNTLRDPIEHVIDSNRYEVFNEGIFDHHQSKIISQGKSFKDYCCAVMDLKSIWQTIPEEELLGRCEEISKMLPTIHLE